MWSELILGRPKVAGNWIEHFSLSTYSIIVIDESAGDEVNKNKKQIERYFFYTM